MKQANGNYIRPPARFNWWLKQGLYFKYMMRELSSLFVGLFSLVLVWGLFRLSQGESAFTAWTHTLWHNLLWLNILVLLFAVYHSYTWFMVTPKAMPIKFKGKRLAPSVIIGAHMMLWIFCSIFVWLLFIYGGDA